MDVVIAGGHGKVGFRLGRLLAERGDRARGLIRRQEHVAELEAAGIEPVLCDQAKADEELQQSGLDWTIARPGRLTDDPGTGRIHAAEKVERGSVPREDVAATLLAVLDEPGTIGVVFGLVSDETPIGEAVGALAQSA